MSRENRLFARMLASTSQPEALHPESQIADIVTTYVAIGLAQLYRRFSLRINYGTMTPIKRSEVPLNPLTLQKGVPRYFPAEELVRVAQAGGKYGRGSSIAPRIRGTNRHEPLPPHRECEFFAITEMHFHSRRSGWEVSRIRIYSTENGWHEYITQILTVRPYLNSENEPEVEITLEDRH